MPLLTSFSRLLKLFSNITSVSFVIVVWKYPEEPSLVCLGTELGYELVDEFGILDFASTPNLLKKIFIFGLDYVYTRGRCVLMRVQVPWSPEDGAKSPGVGVTGGYEPNVSSFPCV